MSRGFLRLGQQSTKPCFFLDIKDCFQEFI